MKSYRFMTALATVAIVCLFASEASAQRGGRGMGQMMQMLTRLASPILAMDEVQEELEFTDEQKEEIGAKAKEMSESLMGDFREAMSGGGDSDMSAIEELVDEMVEKESEIIGKLNDDQKKRLKQLQYQRMAMGIFENEAAAKELGLSDDQKTTIKDANEAMQTKRREAMQEAMESGDRGAVREIMQELAEELQKTVMDALTDEQKEKLEEMKGEDFEFPRRGRRGGRRSDF